MSDIDIHHLGAAYALDALDDRERSAFEAHYPSCEVCRADVIDFRATISHVAEASSTPPPPTLKARVMAEIEQTRQLSPLLPGVAIELAERRRRRQRWTAAGMAAAAAVVAFAAGTLVVARDDEPAYAGRLEAVLGQSDAQFVTLAGSGADGGDGTVKVAWSDSLHSAVVLGDDLPPAPDGQAYELWLIDAEGPIAMGMLDDGEDGEMRAVMDLDAVPEAWGVTMEPEAGSATPTGDLVYHAEV